MNKRKTALELAEILVTPGADFACSELASELRRQHAEIERLRRGNRAMFKLLEKAESSLSDYHQGQRWHQYDLEVYNEVCAAVAMGESDE